MLKDLGNTDKLVEMSSCWRENGMENLCVIANFGKNKLNELYLATNGFGGNHCTCFLIDFLAANIFHCDSLAWAISLDFLLEIAFPTSLIKGKDPRIYDLEIHVVNKNVEKNSFPYQGPNKNICGIAYLISSILVKFNMNFF